MQLRPAHWTHSEAWLPGAESTPSLFHHKLSTYVTSEHLRGFWGQLQGTSCCTGPAQERAESKSTGPSLLDSCHFHVIVKSNTCKRGPCLRTTVAVVEHHVQSYLEKRGFIRPLLPPHCSSRSQGRNSNTEGSLRQELMQRRWSGTASWLTLMACSGPPAQGWPYPQWAWSSHINH